VVDSNKIKKKTLTFVQLLFLLSFDLNKKILIFFIKNISFLIDIKINFKAYFSLLKNLIVMNVKNN
jgi:hypothetical protein